MAIDMDALPGHLVNCLRARVLDGAEGLSTWTCSQAKLCSSLRARILMASRGYRLDVLPGQNVLKPESPHLDGAEGLST